MKKLFIALAALLILAAPASAAFRSFGGGGFRPSIRITPRFSAPKFTMPKTYSAPKYSTPKPYVAPKPYAAPLTKPWEKPAAPKTYQPYVPPTHAPPPVVQHHYHDSGPSSNIWFWMYLFSNHNNQPAPAPAPQPYVPGTPPTATYGQPLPAPPAPAVDQSDDKSTGPRNISAEPPKEDSSPWQRNAIFASIVGALALGAFFVARKMRAV
ncbi:hypothetical protein Cp1R7AA1_076 [Mesorhizobium phage Cp1R7A-A1]|nr:hypothetical protein Cp1R7AA1_076 [Mesorhizobium phage Cp1R7A-A1]